MERVQRRDALLYFARLLALQGGLLAFTVGWAVAAAGVPKVGAPLLAIGFAAFVVAVLVAWVSAVKCRGAKSWFGPGSVTEDANERLGWREVPEASLALGWRIEMVRPSLQAVVGATIVAPVVGVLLATLR